MGSVEAKMDLYRLWVVVFEISIFQPKMADLSPEIAKNVGNCLNRQPKSQNAAQSLKVHFISNSAHFQLPKSSGYL